MGKTTHKMTKHPLFRRWASMLDRCYNQNSKDFKYYGDRGIKVFGDWRNDFLAFYDYVMSLENAMNPGLTIDRIDNNGNYEVGNIQWGTRRDQVLNRRLPINNKSGYKGVSFTKGSYKSAIKINGEVIYLGTFKTATEAVKVRDEYIIEHELFEYPLQTVKEKS